MAKKNGNKIQQLSPERFIRERGRLIPVEKCYLDLESLKELGEGQAVIVRQHKGGKRTVGAYLVDAWCRGVRDAFYLDRMEESDYRDLMDRLLENPAQHLEEVPYEVLHNWVFGALEYAAEAGFAPCKDFAVARYLLEDDEDESIPIIEYEFGLHGKHHLVCDSMDEFLRLRPVLDAHLGEGNYTWGTNPYAAGEEYADGSGNAPAFRDDETVRRLTLRIELENVKPLVWRKVEVPSNLMLASFHELIQAAMGWEDSHLYCFRTKERSFEEGEEFELAVGDLLKKVGDKLTYEYDFGDGWVHKIEVQKMEDSTSDDRSVRVLGGKNACPPEDIGGPWYYTDFVAALNSGDKKKLKKEFGETLEWLGDDFDPAYFDLEDVQEYVEGMFEE